MKFEVRLSGRAGKCECVVELQRDGGRWRISLDGNPVDADVVEVVPHTFSILLHGRSHEIRVSPLPNGLLKVHGADEEFTAEIVDPRAWRGRHSALEAEGQQQIAAPIPGKVVRVLVKPGDVVETGQGLLVVEAMKMQNEIRSPKNGTVERLTAKEGQAVNAGELLAIIS